MLCLKLYALPESSKSIRFQPKSYVTRTTKSLFDNLNIVILELPNCPTFHHFITSPQFNGLFSTWPAVRLDQHIHARLLLFWNKIKKLLRMVPEIDIALLQAISFSEFASDSWREVMLIPDFSIFPFADSSKNRTFGQNAKIHDIFYQLKYFVTLVKRLCLRRFECS